MQNRVNKNSKKRNQTNCIAFWKIYVYELKIYVIENNWSFQQENRKTQNHQSPELTFNFPSQDIMDFTKNYFRTFFTKISRHA